ncbi:ATP synthase F1 subunit gamma [Candidatus Gottesmanbacteria bacterium]|nr:ATP synthase F1 subunit gamma [Candidatus Gottesmanbacteria bacterium]
MANIRLIKRRITSAKNIAQITRAMELVAASKMKKAQAQAITGKLYAQKIYDMVMLLAAKVDAHAHPLLSKPKTVTGKRLVILISTNKGLCGGLNTNLFRFTLREYGSRSSHDFVALGKKGALFLVRTGNAITADFSREIPFTNVVPAVTELAASEFIKGSYEGVDLVYNEFVSAFKQVPRKKIILPLTIETGMLQKEKEIGEFLIEPSVSEVFDALLPHYVENQIRDAILQAEASEHSARMIAMRNATDNALSFMQELTLVYNKARQEKITYEISDMVTARLAVE